MRSDRKFVRENMKRMLLKEYIKKETRRAGFGGADIQRTVTHTRITLHVERPGIVIGRRGNAITKMTNIIEDKYNLENPLVEVESVENPAMNPQIMAEKLAHALEDGWHFRRSGHATVRRIMGAGARGCLVVISGKLTGARHRTAKFMAGTIKYCGDTARKWMRVGSTTAKMKPGVLGVTVKIMPPESQLPEDITFKEEASVPPESGAAEEEGAVGKGEVKEGDGAEAPPPPVAEEEERVKRITEEVVSKVKRVVGDEVVVEDDAVDILRVDAAREPDPKGGEGDDAPGGERSEDAGADTTPEGAPVRESRRSDVKGSKEDEKG